MRTRLLLVAALSVAAAGDVGALDRSWENPVFLSEDAAVAAARNNAFRLDTDQSPGLRMFVDLTLAEGDIGKRHPSSTTTRKMVDGLLITHPTAFIRNDTQRRTIERFFNEIPRQRAVLEKRLALFGYPELPGVSYCRLVDSVNAFSDLNRASTDKMSQVGGVTYYCRYMVLPLSYVGDANLRELRRSAARNPSLDVDETIRRWQRESFASLVNTFRHELVHVHTNSTLDVPVYSDRNAYPTWFHEGTATYLAADPHSGLSATYQEYQDVFFFLVQRYGVGKLQAFYATVFGGSDVGTALEEVYSVSDSARLFVRSGRWHRTKDLIKTILWIAALAIVVTALRGADRPYIGALQILAAVALALAIPSGLAEHLYGLRGSAVVSSVKVGLGVAAVTFGFFGLRRIRRHAGRLESEI